MPRKQILLDPSVIDNDECQLNKFWIISEVYGRWQTSCQNNPVFPSMLFCLAELYQMTVISKHTVICKRYTAVVWLTSPPKKYIKKPTWQAPSSSSPSVFSLSLIFGKRYENPSLSPSRLRAALVLISSVSIWMSEQSDYSHLIFNSVGSDWMFSSGTCNSLVSSV